MKVYSALQQGSAAALLGLVPVICSGCNQNHAGGLEDEVKEPGPVRLGCSSITNKQTEGEMALPSCFSWLAVLRSCSRCMVLPSVVGGRAGRSSWCSRFVCWGERVIAVC